MSGNKLAQAMRDAHALPRAANPKESWINLAVVAVTVAALGGLGVAWWTTQGAPPPETPMRVGPAAPVAAMAWTPEDAARCRAFANKAGSQPVPPEMALAIPSVTDGFGIMASLLECELTTKMARFCSSGEKAALVDRVNDYLGRTDLLVTGLHVQGAPMAVLGEMFGGEISAGSGMYEMQKADTLAFIEMYDGRVTKGLKALAEAGFIQAADFGGFMGMGVPARIGTLLGGVTARKSGCAPS